MLCCAKKFWEGKAEEQTCVLLRWLARGRFGVVVAFSKAELII